MNAQRYKHKIATILQQNYDFSPLASEMLIDKFDVDGNIDQFEQLTPNEAAMFMIEVLLLYYKEEL